jgi:hypothetical protein
VSGDGPVDRRETLMRIRDRVKTSDLARQMPLARDMPLRDREALVLWLENLE